MNKYIVIIIFSILLLLVGGMLVVYLLVIEKPEPCLVKPPYIPIIPQPYDPTIPDRFDIIPNQTLIQGRVEPSSDSYDGNILYYGTTDDSKGCAELCDRYQAFTHADRYTIIPEYSKQCFCIVDLSKEGTVYEVGWNSGYPAETEYSD